MHRYLLGEGDYIFGSVDLLSFFRSVCLLAALDPTQRVMKGLQ